MDRTASRVDWPYLRFVPCVREREPRTSKRGLDEGSYTTTVTKSLLHAVYVHFWEQGECVNGEASSFPSYSA